MSSNYSMMHHIFTSPLRGVTAAVPHNKRDMSSSPYMAKKRSEVRIFEIKVLVSVKGWIR